MKTLFIGFALSLLSTVAFAHDPIGPVNAAAVLANPAPLSEHLSNHQLYVQNLKDAGFSTKTTPIGAVDASVVMAPDHSKVPRGQRYIGNIRDRSTSY